MKVVVRNVTIEYYTLEKLLNEVGYENVLKVEPFYVYENGSWLTRFLVIYKSQEERNG